MTHEVNFEKPFLHRGKMISFLFIAQTDRCVHRSVFYFIEKRQLEGEGETNSNLIYSREYLFEWA